MKASILLTWQVIGKILLCSSKKFLRGHLSYNCHQMPANTAFFAFLLMQFMS